MFKWFQALPIQRRLPLLMTGLVVLTSWIWNFWANGFFALLLSPFVLVCNFVFGGLTYLCFWLFVVSFKRRKLLARILTSFTVMVFFVSFLGGTYLMLIGPMTHPALISADNKTLTFDGHTYRNLTLNEDYNRTGSLNFFENVPLSYDQNKNPIYSVPHHGNRVVLSEFMGPAYLFQKVK